MKLKLSIPKELADSWRPVIEHHFNLTLSPLVASVLNPKVIFLAVNEQGNRQYRCELTAKLSNGTLIELTSQHPDGKTAIGSVFLRARRDVTRRRRTLGAPVQLNRRDAPAPLP
jgi:ribosome-associated translation inhibitor RaiA